MADLRFWLTFILPTLIAFLLLALFVLDRRRQMIQPPARIRQLLDADSKNTEVSPELMAALHPWAVAGFDETAALFKLLYGVLGNWKEENEVESRLRKMASDNGLTDQQLVKRLMSGTVKDIDGAEAAWKRLWTLRMVKYLVMACQRYWSLGALELFRLRHSAAMGYLRLQVESLALVVLFLEDDSLAQQWSDLRSREDGQKFFRESQQRVKAVLKKFDLDKVYDIASGTAQHVRMAGLVRSMANTKPGELSLTDQEFNRDDPYNFHLGIAHFHRIQARILSALGSVLPHAGADEWKEKAATFIKNAAGLWQRLEKRYAARIQDEASGAP